MKGKRIFSLRPSFYAVFSGALLSIAINLFTNLFFIQKESIDLIFLQFTIFIILMLIISSGSFIYLSLVLEENREEFVLADFLDKIHTEIDLRVKLWFLFLLGSVSLALALITVSLWLYRIIS